MKEYQAKYQIIYWKDFIYLLKIAILIDFKNNILLIYLLILSIMHYINNKIFIEEVM
jgi:hypothetical protein